MFAQLLSDIGSLWEKYGTVYLNGIANTLILATVSTLIGCVIGFFCGILQTIPCGPNENIIKRVLLKIVRIVIRAYVEVFRGTPMILQAVFIFYGLPYFFGVSFKDIWTVSIIVVSVNTGAYMAESVRGGIMSIDPGQFEGAKAIGMNHWQTMLYVILPLKDTSVMFIIGFSDFFAVHKMVSGAVFKYFPSAFMEMIGYLCLTLLASFLLRKLEKKLAGKPDYELVNTDQLVLTAGTYSYPSEAGSPFDEASKEFKGEKK